MRCAMHKAMRQTKETHIRIESKLLLGPKSAKELARELGVSQSAISRNISALKDRVLRAGRSVATQYALKRAIPKVETSVPLYLLNESAQATHEATLHPVHAEGFYVESHGDAFSSRLFEDIPFYLNDLRPSGFLGRLIPRIYKDRDFPPDIQKWSGNDTLRYLTCLGWDLIGNAILGDEAYHLYKELIDQATLAESEDIATRYQKIADNLLLLGDAGSSAGGEQPKFTTRNDENTPVLVKFSPPRDSNIGKRRSDLLVAEHIAHQILGSAGLPSSDSRIILGSERTFLEVKRFDRTTQNGRQGVISLGSLDLEYVGSKHSSWLKSASTLASQGVIDNSLLNEVERLELFGSLIGNTDMHFWNLSFYCRGEKILGLCPVYDMLPMMYAPQNEQITPRELTLPRITPRQESLYNELLPLAASYWRMLSEDTRISEDFRQIAFENSRKAAN